MTSIQTSNGLDVVLEDGKIVVTEKIVVDPPVTPQGVTTIYTTRDRASLEDLSSRPNGTIGLINGYKYISDDNATGLASVAADEEVDGLKHYGRKVHAQHLGMDPENDMVTNDIKFAFINSYLPVGKKLTFDDGEFNFKDAHLTRPDTTIIVDREGSLIQIDLDGYMITVAPEANNCHFTGAGTVGCRILTDDDFFPDDNDAGIPRAAIHADGPDTFSFTKLMIEGVSRCGVFADNVRNYTFEDVRFDGKFTPDKFSMTWNGVNSRPSVHNYATYFDPAPTGDATFKVNGCRGKNTVSWFGAGNLSGGASPIVDPEFKHNHSEDGSDHMAYALNVIGGEFAYNTSHNGGSPFAILGEGVWIHHNSHTADDDISIAGRQLFYSMRNCKNCIVEHNYMKGPVAAIEYGIVNGLTGLDINGNITRFNELEATVETGGVTANIRFNTPGNNCRNNDTYLNLMTNVSNSLNQGAMTLSSDDKENTTGNKFRANTVLSKGRAPGCRTLGSKGTEMTGNTFLRDNPSHSGVVIGMQVDNCIDLFAGDNKHEVLTPSPNMVYIGLQNATNTVLSAIDTVFFGDTFDIDNAQAGQHKSQAYNQFLKNDGHRKVNLLLPERSEAWN